MRQTKQKNLILNIVNNSCSHPTALEIYNICRKDIPNISLGTVYRNLNCLVDSGDILRIKMPDNIDRFDKSFNKHAHFMCIKCNKIVDIDHDFKNIDIIDNNKVLDYEINFKGICEKCEEGEK